jgi:hypothetical protein
MGRSVFEIRRSAFSLPAISRASALSARPVMPSATLADSRLSTAPRRVKDNAIGNTARTAAVENIGSLGVGTPLGSWPKWLPMVSTGKWNSQVASVASVTAIPQVKPTVTGCSGSARPAATGRSASA